MRENLLPGIELVNGDCAAVLPGLPPADLILTSPPYDGMREYGGYSGAFDFDAIAAACVANLAPGGVLVWVVADQVVDGDVTGTSFRQALHFKELGLKLHLQLICDKWALTSMRPNAYFQTHEYMFVFSKGKPKTANLLHDKPNVAAGRKQPNQAISKVSDDRPPFAIERHTIKDMGRLGSIWKYRNVVYGEQADTSGLKYQQLTLHPAKFKKALARDHILSWTNPGDLVIDPMVGSGTTLRAAADLERRAIGVEINPGYCDLIRQRLAQSVLPLEG